MAGKTYPWVDTHTLVGRVIDTAQGNGHTAIVFNVPIEWIVSLSSLSDSNEFFSPTLVQASRLVSLNSSGATVCIAHLDGNTFEMIV